MITKTVQLDLFVNTEREKERLEKEEFEKMTKKSIRALFYRINEMEDQILSQQKYIDMIREMQAAQ